MTSISINAKNAAITVVIVLGIVTGTALITKQYFRDETTYVDPCTLPNVTCTKSLPGASSTVPEPIPTPPSTGNYWPTTSTLITIEEFRRQQYGNRSDSPYQNVIVPVEWQKPVRAKIEDLYADVSQYPLNRMMREPYLRGKITDGPAKGSLLYSVEVPFEGMGSGIETSSTYTILVTPSKKSLAIDDDGGLFQGGSQDRPSFIGFFNLPTSTSSNKPIAYEFSQTVLPETLTLKNGKKVYVDGDFTGQTFISSRKTLNCQKNICEGYERVADTIEGYTILKKSGSTSDAKYVVTEDGVLHYIYASLFADSAMDTPFFRAVLSSRSLLWDEAHKNADVFVSYYAGGCGSSIQNNVLSESDLKSSDLVIIGQTSGGDPLYGVKDYSPQTETQKAYDNWFIFDGNGEKPSYEDFLKRYPVPFFVWKNAFGENIRFVLGDSVAPAECGKPVIYLYPEKTTDVSVKLGSNINVTVSEPTYPSNGWKARATPSGELTVDGKVYGSLFWEGTGVGYDVPKEGFILKDGEVDARLIQILAQYGLSERESKEFREFWVPRMTGAPYYRVSFVTTEDWNKAAPLSVRPVPKTVIRIFMDWEKLQTEKILETPVINTPKREGFTLVEWGGVLRP